MAKYVIVFNQNADSIGVDFQVGGSATPVPELLWGMGDAVVEAYGPIREVGYAVDSVSRVDVQETVPRPA